MANVLKDKHGVFIKINGSLFRPQPSTLDRRHPKRVHDTAIVPGIRATVRRIQDTPFVSVSVDGINEWWVSHGSYMGRAAPVPSESLWSPPDIAINCN